MASRDKGAPPRAAKRQPWAVPPRLLPPSAPRPLPGTQGTRREAAGGAGAALRPPRVPHLGPAAAITARPSPGPPEAGSGESPGGEIEDLKKINHELRQHVIQLLGKKQVVESQVDRFTCKNCHLCKELAAIGKLSEELEKNLLLNTADKELEEAKIQI